MAIEDPPSQPVVVKEKRKKGYVPRGIYIRKDIELQQFGYTPGCDGCIAAQRGLGHGQHSSTCKERTAAELEKTDEGKMRLELIRKREEETHSEASCGGGTKAEGRCFSFCTSQDDSCG